MIKNGLTSYDLKRIALITMLVDHFNAAVVYAGLRTGHLGKEYVDVYYAICSLTRMSYLLFIFLQVEALQYTRNRMNYLLRLVVFAFISQIPYNMLFSNGAVYGHYNWTWDYLLSFESLNIFFTLALSFVCIWSMDEILKRWQGPAGFIVCAAVIGLGAFIGEKIHIDYNWGGILATGMAYLARRYSTKEMIAAAITIPLGIWQFIRGKCLVTWFSLLEFYAILGIIPISMYNGKPGKKSHKWFFYFFYPIHLFLLALLSKYLYG